MTNSHLRRVDYPTGHVLDFVVPGRPVSKKRPRITSRGGYTPQATREFEELVASCANDALEQAGLQPPLPGLFMVRLVFGHHTNQQPDLDNLVKAVLDGLQYGMRKDGHKLLDGPLADDRQVVAIMAHFDWQGRDEYTLVELRQVEVDSDQ